LASKLDCVQIPHSYGHNQLLVYTIQRNRTLRIFLLIHARGRMLDTFFLACF